MEDYLNLYFREIVYHKPSGKKDSVCGVSSYEALNIEEAQLGSLYLAGKIFGFSDKKHKNYDFLLGVLASVMKREFYSDYQKTTIEALESTLQSANIYLADFVKKGHKEWIGNLNFACLASHKNEIHIGQTGEMLVYLLRRNSMSNIAKKFSNKEKSSDPSKTFTNIASGRLEENDKIFIATPDILDILPAMKIKEMLSYPSTEQIFEYIKKNLKKTDSLACLILEAKTKSPVKKEKPVPIKEIEEVIGLDLERTLNSQSNKINNVLKTKINPSSKIYKPTMALSKHHLLKYSLIFFLFLLIILSPYLVQKLGYDSKIDHINNLIKRMTQKTSNSEISLIYQDQPNAQSLLQQAKTLATNIKGLLSQLPEQAQEEPNQAFQKIEAILNAQKDSINKVINITQPEQIADLSKNTFTFNPHGILKMENNLYLYELTSGFIYKIDLNDLYNPTLIFLSSKDTFELGAVLGSSIVLLADPEKIYVYGKNDAYNTYLLKPDLENTFYIKDVAEYNGNIYFLDTNRLDIFKYVPAENALQGTGWLNDQYKEELADAQSIAVDGSIYISKADGRITEFISGRKVKEFKPDISPELTKGSQIFTKTDMKNLYILDPENNRVIAINKKDDIAIQYISSEFDSLRDLWITPDEQTMFLLNGLKIFRVSI